MQLQPILHFSARPLSQCPDPAEPSMGSSCLELDDTRVGMALGQMLVCDVSVVCP